MTRALVVAHLEEQVGDARAHLDVLLQELDRRRHAVVRMEKRLKASWPLIGAGVVAVLGLAIGAFALVRQVRHRG